MKPSTRRRIKLASVGIGCALLAVVIHAVGWGRLMAISPWAPGFERMQSSRAVVYFRPNMRPAALEVARIVDALVARAERFHALTFRRRPEILLAGDEAEHRARSWGPARFRALPVRGRIFVAPRAMAQAARNQIHLGTYLQHELGHTLLLQHLGWSGIGGLPPWFEEGLATLSADQLGVDGYFDRRQVLAWWRSGRQVLPSQYQSRWRDSQEAMALPKDERFHFLYSQFAMLIEDLLARHGRQRFQRLLERLLHGEGMGSAFAAEFGTDPDSYYRELISRLAGVAAVIGRQSLAGLSSAWALVYAPT